MAEKTGGGISVGQKLTRWVLQKAASYTGLSLTDPKGWRPLMGNSSLAGRTVNQDTAMQVSTVYACVRIIAESVGQLPIAVYERQSNGNAVKVEHDLAAVLAESPNADMTSVEFREAGQVNLGLQGNSYSLREDNASGAPVSLYPIPAHCVDPRRNEYGDIEYRVLDRGRWDTYPREKIWHIRGFGSTGLVGYSPIGLMRNAMGLAMASEEFGSKVFAQGAHVSGIVKIPNWLKEDQRKIAQQNLSDVYAGLDNAHKLMLLEGGMEFDANAGIMPPADLQLLELRRFQVQEICRIYGVPPHMVAELERATFSNIEQMSLEFVTFCLLPWLRRWESSANRWLLKPADRKRFFVAFNFEGLLRADTAARGEFLTKMIANGVMSRNEARAKENLNQVAGQGMDEFTVQSNMAPLDKLAALLLAQQGGAPAKSGDTILDLHLPESLAHDVKHVHETPEVERLAHQVGQLAERVIAKNADTEKLILQVLGEIKSSAYRVAIFNDLGEPIGSRPAQPHELH